MPRYKHLVLDAEERVAYLLGYDMKLTPSEFKILFMIMQEKTITTDGLLEKCGFVENDLKKGNLPVHICSINRKAQKIGGRKLILFKRFNYYLNEFM